MQGAILRLIYVDEDGTERVEITQRFEQVEGEDMGMTVSSSVNPNVRPLAMTGLYTLAMMALLDHYARDGQYTPAHELRGMLEKASQLTDEALELQVALEGMESKIRTIPITPEEIERLFGGNETLQ